MIRCCYDAIYFKIKVEVWFSDAVPNQMMAALPLFWNWTECSVLVVWVTASTYRFNFQRNPCYWFSNAPSEITTNSQATNWGLGMPCADDKMLKSPPSSGCYTSQFPWHHPWIQSVALGRACMAMGSSLGRAGGGSYPRAQDQDHAIIRVRPCLPLTRHAYHHLCRCKSLHAITGWPLCMNRIRHTIFLRPVPSLDASVSTVCGLMVCTVRQLGFYKWLPSACLCKNGPWSWSFHTAC